jgi:exosome complex component RRP42
MSTMLPSNNTIDKIISLLKEDKRFDGRKATDHRPLEVSFDVSNMAEGSARVKLGKTEVIAGVKLALGAPYPDSPNKGNLMISADLVPLASPRFELGPPKFPAIELPRLVDRAVRESGMIDFAKLCVTPGEKVWTVIIDIFPINDDGNLIDVASLAALAALKKAVMPGIKDGNPDYKNRTATKVPLVEGIEPITITAYKVGEEILLDPTAEEELAAEVKIMFGLSKWNGKYMVNSSQKSGTVPLTLAEIEKITSLLQNKYEELNEKLKKFL